MKSILASAPACLLACLGAGLVALPVAGRAQAAPAIAPPAVLSSPGSVVQVEDRVDRKEPHVTHTVTEDGGSRIDELVVRGEVQHVVVTPKVGLTKSYEIIVQRGGREQIDGTGGATGAIGKRVWNVFAF
ncbi:MAG: hypothetical protein M3O01_01315 [Pseudomonadota bacterium]|nr:hypothetical protein [Pseudomonadota bacterium]